MTELLFGTHNAHKGSEIRAMLGPHYLLKIAADYPGLAEPEETGTTLEANALLKARYYREATGLPTFADDTGLMIDALDGEPGVYSSSYAGVEGDAAGNMALVLQRMQGQAVRTARFRTVIAYIDAVGNEHTFVGEMEGSIANAPLGTNGFGYDPIFVPQGSTRTLAEHTPDEKNAISHRGRAFRAFMDWLKAQS